MASLSLTEVGVLRANGAAARTRPALERAPAALALALLAVVLYAAFAHAAVGIAADARLQVVIAAVASVAAGAWLWSGTLRVSLTKAGALALALLAAFAIWSGVSLIWSVSADHTWAELNRVITYTVALVLAIAVGSSLKRSAEFVAGGFVLVALAVTLYALGQKLTPGLHVSGLFSLDRTGQLPRLQDPLGYWNALALFVAMAVPCALALAVDASRGRRIRLAALCATELMLLVIGLTYSRGGLLALVVALIAGLALSAIWLRSLMWLALAIMAAIPPLVFGFANHSLTTAGVRLSARELAGGELAIVLVVSTVAMLLIARKLLELEDRVQLAPARRRLIVRLLALGLAAVVVAGVLAMAVSARGLGGTISHAWDDFTATHAANVAAPSRLVSADSANRWVWWKEALGAFSDRPLTGWGAGSFGVVHLLYRRDTLGVQEPHSLPLQFLAETGAIGAALGLGALALLVVVAIHSVRRLPAGRDRLFAAAALTAAVAYTVHSLYDWDWDIPAVTLPAILFLGVLVGSSRREAHPRPGGPGRALRALALIVTTIWLCAFALSAALPAIAASDAGSALVLAGNGSLQSATSSALLASELDPLSDSGSRINATIAIRHGQYTRARHDLLDALHRAPSDGAAWQSLALVELELNDPRDAATAAARPHQLDPVSRGLQEFAASYAQYLELVRTPPRDSATASRTPGL